MSMFGTFADMEQNDKIGQLERRVKRLERGLNGGIKMSGIIKELIGRECKIAIDFDDYNCTVLDADEEFIKLLVHEKKGDKTLIRRIDMIDKIEIV